MLNNFKKVFFLVHFILILNFPPVLIGADIETCHKVSVSQVSYRRSIEEISNLHEFLITNSDIKKIKKNNRMQFSKSAEPYLLGSSCYFEIQVFINRVDEHRVSIWQSFLIDSNGSIKFINDLEWNYVTLDEWRKKIDSLLK